MYGGFLYRCKGITTNLLLGLLSYVVPKNKSQLLIGSRFGDKFSGNPKYFFLYLCKNKPDNCKPLWITANRKILSDLRAKKMPVIYLYSLKGFWAILRSEYLIFDNSTRGISYFTFLPGRFNKIETWHGVSGIKTMFNRPLSKQMRFPIIRKLDRSLTDRERKSYYAVITCSEKWRKLYSSAFKYDNMKVLGYPRNDVLYDKSMTYEDYREKLHLDKYKKIILYCPTFNEDFSPRNPFSIRFLDKLNQYLKQNNYLFLDKRHPNENISDSQMQFSNMINVTREVEDIQDLLVHVHVVITDYSSGFMDFCLLDRPIIFYPYDYDNYMKKRGMVIDYFNELPGPFVRNEDDLLECLKNIDQIFADSEYQKKFNLLKNSNHFYQDGKSCERLYDFLYEK